MPDANETPVGKWLTDNGFPDLVEPFYTRSKRELDDVNPDVLAGLVTERRANDLWAKWPKPAGWDNPVKTWLENNRGGRYAWDFFKNEYRTLTSVSDAVIDQLVTAPGLRPDLKAALVAARAPVAPANEVTLWLTANGAAKYALAFADQSITKQADVTDALIDRLVTEAPLARKLKEAQPVDATAVGATVVTRWLIKYKGGSFANAFYRENYRDSEKNIPDAAIDRLVGSTNPELATILKRAKTVAATPPIPPLPNGTALDLTKPLARLSTETASFELPKNLGPAAAGGGDVEDIEVFTQDEWIGLGTKVGMLLGWNMDGDQPVAATKPVYDYRWSAPFFYRNFATSEIGNSTISTVTTTVEESHNYVKEGFDKVSAQGSYMFAAASGERTRKWREASQQASKTINMVGRWRYPKARVRLADCTVVSALFVLAIDAALASTTPKRALEAVFREFGHAVPTEVVIGCELYNVKQVTVTSTAEERKSEETYGASLNANLGKFSGGGSYSAGGGTSETSGKTIGSEVMMFQCRGGDDALNGNPGEWAKTTKDPRRWHVIDRLNLVSTVNLLDATRKSQVLAHWPVTEFGDTESWSTDRQFTAPTDGFLTGVRWSYNAEGSRGYLYADVGDDRTRYGMASVHTYGKGDRHVSRAGFFIPLKQGQKLQGKMETLNSMANGAYFRFVRLQLRETVMLKGWSDLTAGQWSPPGHGFFLCTLDAVGGGDGYAVLRKRSSPGTVLAQSAVHGDGSNDIHCGAQSFCVPVQKGDILEIATEGNATFSHRWIELDGFAVGAPVERDFDMSYPADGDGFLVCWLSAANETRGHVDVAVASSDALLPRDEAASASSEWRVGATSVHHYDHHVVKVKANTVTVPVAARKSYRATYVKGWGDVTSRLYWVPLVPPPPTTPAS